MSLDRSDSATEAGVKRASQGPIRILYRFKFSGGAALGALSKEFEIQLDRETLGLVFPHRKSYPHWTDLSFRQCSNCPLRPQDHPRCPVAASLVEPLEFFEEAISHTQVEVEIETAERVYRKTTALQFALGSLIGIHMVTSGCPVMDKLRPLVRLHLPFASSEETMFRAVSMYLLAQYLVKRRGGSPDWELAGLTKIYDEVSTVNECFKKRILAVEKEDASVNALVHLDLFAKTTNLLLSNETLGKIEGYFRPYLDGSADEP